MEKIKTPLGELYNDICDKITRVNSLLYGKKPQRNLNTRHDLERKLMTLKEIKSHIKTLLPTERDMIIDFAQQYKSYCFQSASLPDSARTRFTQTFESYE